GARLPAVRLPAAGTALPLLPLLLHLRRHRAAALRPPQGDLAGGIPCAAVQPVQPRRGRPRPRAAAARAHAPAPAHPDPPHHPPPVTDRIATRTPWAS